MKLTDNFYEDIPKSNAMEDIFSLEFSRLVPNNWILIITDVVQSTKAVEAGQYRDVNTSGGLAVIAIANLIGTMNFPFIFGGDGVTMLIPEHWEALARDVLFDTRKKVASLFNLQLRIGVVPIRTLYDLGYEIRIAKLKISAQYTQAIIDGYGLEVAESWVKSPTPNNPFLVVSQKTVMEADFHGFTCRWQDVPSEKGEIVSLIVKFCSQDMAVRKKELSAFLRFLTKHYGRDSDYHPIQAKQMQSGDKRFLWREIKIRSEGHSWAKRCGITLSVIFEIVMIRAIQLFHLPIHILWMDILRLKENNVVSSDFRKFDGSLKMVISGSPDNRNQLIAYLKSGYQQKQLFYGFHISNRAVLTCLMHTDSGSEVHFVDGADGGYTMAAKQIKDQLLGKL